MAAHHPKDESSIAIPWKSTPHWAPVGFTSANCAAPMVCFPLPLALSPLLAPFSLSLCLPSLPSFLPLISAHH